MTHEESNLIMKRRIAEAFKEKMRKKPIQRITVTELINACNINRKTFYYHFEDIYAVLKWILEEEAINIVRQFDLMLEFEDCIAFVMDYVEQNEFLLNCAYDSLGREELRKFLFDDISEITSVFIDHVAENSNASPTADFRNFICTLLTESLVSMLIDQFKHRQIRSKETLLAYISLMINYSIPELLRRGSENLIGCRDTLSEG